MDVSSLNLGPANYKGVPDITREVMIREGRAWLARRQ